MVTPAWGISAERYERMYVEHAQRLGIPEVSSPVLRFVDAGQHVLDLGCATGWQARQLVERGCTVVGVEVDADAAERARQWCRRVVVADLDVHDVGADLAGERFDVVAAGDILEHLRDPARTLRSVASLLRDGGTVVASIPNVAHGSVRLALLTGEFPYEEAGLLDRTHLRFFTRASVEELFAASGYAIDQLERVHVPIDQATPYDRDRLPAGVEDAVAAMPEATTFQFVVVARPSPEPAVPRARRRLRR
jgi:2-polyprenyl-3-methyl-5-hydroxy-6-metoxy-1,4-benzoquinol methylase